MQARKSDGRLRGSGSQPLRAFDPDDHKGDLHDAAHNRLLEELGPPQAELSATQYFREHISMFDIGSMLYAASDAWDFFVPHSHDIRGEPRHRKEIK
jgi:hypothetical protein